MVRATKQDRLWTRSVSSHAFSFKTEKRHVERPVLFAKILFLKWQFLTGKAHDYNILLDISQAVAVTSSAALFKQVPLLLVPFSSYIFISFAIHVENEKKVCSIPKDFKYFIGF